MPRQRIGKMSLGGKSLVRAVERFGSAARSGWHAAAPSKPTG
jgi:hypothetical protein